MRIGLNALLCSRGQNYRRTGVSRYIDELIRGLASSTPGDDLVAYVDRGFEPEGWSATQLRHALIPVRNPAVRIGWEMTGLTMRAFRDRLDVFHGTVNTLPFGIRAATVVTVHDLAFLKYPEQITGKRYQYLRRMIESSVKRSDLVLTPSKSTRSDVINLFGAAPELVVATPLGVDPRFRPATPDEMTSVVRKYGVVHPYILSVGTLEPRKNLPMLIRSFAALRDEIPHDLVLAGPAGWLMEEIERTIADSWIQERIRRIGFVEDADLAALYSGADVVAIPSLYEGFGLPVLEAMASGAPVLTSNVSSLPEIAGDAGILVDPTNLESVVDGLRRVLGSEDLRRQMRAAGPAQAAQFTWARTAAETLVAYRSVA